MSGDYTIASTVAPIAVPYKGNRNLTSTRLFLEGVLTTLKQIDTALDRSETRMDEILRWALALDGGSIRAENLTLENDTFRQPPRSFEDILAALAKLDDAIAEVLKKGLET